MSTNRGEPLVLQKKLSLSGIAFENAARRLIGKQDYFVDLQVRGLMWIGLVAFESVECGWEGDEGAPGFRQATHHPPTPARPVSTRHTRTHGTQNADAVQGRVSENRRHVQLQQLVWRDVM